MGKLIIDGKVAVLRTNGYGAGWYTWNTEYPDCVFDADIASHVLNDATPAVLKEAATNKWPQGFWEAKYLTVEWVDEGSCFIIKEFDGCEHLEFVEPCFKA